MSYPDVLIVDRSSSRLLVCVEAKLRLQNRPEAEAQLKAYMRGTRCPVGILATPEWLQIFVDQYGTTASDSVSMIGPFDMTNVPGRPTPNARFDMDSREFAFEAAVQDWIERVGSKAYRASLPEALRDALDEYVASALFIGEVRAAGPRWHRSMPAAS